MRILLKVRIPVEEGNRAAKEGFKALPQIIEDQKPEAVYCYEENGERTVLLVLNLSDSSEIPGIAEPWFLAVNAKVEFHPAMTIEDLQKAGPSIEKAVQKYA